jgi:hypothetical protein
MIDMGHVYSGHDLVWRGNDICVGRNSRPIVSIVPDAAYPKMWRIRMSDGRLSDMANRTWVKDAAASVALSILNHDIRRPEAPPMRQKAVAA